VLRLLRALKRRADKAVVHAMRGLPPIFEAVINTVRKAAPGATIAFNATPHDSADAAARWLVSGSREVDRS
jgi:protoheme ferro-lyase